MPAAPVYRPTSMFSVPAATRWLDAACGTHVPQVLVVIGLGDGALLDALEARGGDCQVIALEPDPAVACRGVLARRRERWHARLTYLVGPAYHGAASAFQRFPDGSDACAVLVHPDLLQQHAAAVAAARVARDILFGVRANVQARRSLAPGYLRNTLRNLPAIARGGDIATLEGCADGRAAVVVAAGPSLDRSLDELRQVRNRVLVVAVDTALRPLLAAGIEPHLTVGLDPGAANARHFAALPPTSMTMLVAEGALAPDAVRRFDGRTFWFRVANHHPWPWANSLGVDAGHLDVWGSVLTAAFEVARLAGADPLVLVGADLAYTAGQPYCRNATYELDWAIAAAAGRALADTWIQQMAPAGPRETRDLHGRPTLASPVLLSFRDWLVSHASRCGRRVVNATGAGTLFGAGIEITSLTEAVRATSRAPLVLPPAMRRKNPAPEQFRDVLSCGAAGVSEAPLAEWARFTAGTVDIPELVQILTSLPSDLGTPGSKGAGVIPGRPVLALPEGTARYRLALESRLPLPPPVADVGVDDPLAEAWRWLDALTARLLADEPPVPACDFAQAPEPLLCRRYHWPDDEMRWLVTSYEALLGHAWGDQPAAANAWLCAPPRPRRLRAEDLPEPPDDLHTHTSLALAQSIQGWRACAAARGPERPAVALPATSTIASLDRRRDMARTCTGMLRRAGEASPAAFLPPTLVSQALGQALAIACADTDSVACVTPYSNDLTRVDADGGASVMQTWPRPITGALRTPEGTLIAWDNGQSGLPGCEAPAAMVLSPAGDDLRILPIDVKPTVGTWWRNRVYWTCYPASDGSWAGVASWTPGESVRRELDGPSCYAIHGTSAHLLLAPCGFERGTGFTRQSPGAALTWLPGQAPVPGAPSPLGVCSEQVTRHAWTACAHPDTDVIRVVAPDGREIQMTCHFPWRVAWIGRTLAVSTGERDLLLFPALLDEVERLLRVEN